jgi:hypothetical protein
MRIEVELMATAGVTQAQWDTMKPREKKAYLEKYPNSKYQKKVGTKPTKKPAGNDISASELKDLMTNLFGVKNVKDVSDTHATKVKINGGPSILNIGDAPEGWIEYHPGGVSRRVNDVQKDLYMVNLKTKKVAYFNKVRGGITAEVVDLDAKGRKEVTADIKEHMVWLKEKERREKHRVGPDGKNFPKDVADTLKRLDDWVDHQHNNDTTNNLKKFETAFIRKFKNKHYYQRHDIGLFEHGASDFLLYEALKNAPKSEVVDFVNSYVASMDASKKGKKATPSGRTKVRR